MENATPVPATTSVQALRSAIDAALAERDRVAAIVAATEAVDAGTISVPDLYTLVLGPLLTDTGAQWQTGSIRVWEEHYASATVRTIIESLASRVITAASSVPSRSETVLLACPPDEHHDLGLRMLLDRFLLAGYEAHFLGADTPVSEIRSAAEQLGATLVVLSASTHYHRVCLRDTVESLKRSLPTGTRLAVGGPAFAHDSVGFSELVLNPTSLDLPGQAPDVEDG